MKKALLVMLLCCLSSFLASAQITEVELGVNGLTCSQCSRSVEMRIRKLSFVKDVQMNLEHTDAKIFFKDRQNIDIDKLAQAVVDAGFSVRFLQATFTFNHISVSPNSCFSYDRNSYRIVKGEPTVLNGSTTLKFIGDEFLPKKEAKKWLPYMKNTCAGNPGKTYYVTM